VVLAAPVSRKAHALLSLGFAAASFLVASGARADVSSWASVASGPSWLHDDSGNRTVASLQMEAGVGTPPSGFMSVGGLLHLETQFGQGSDVGVLARFASRGFVLGDWGPALDLGWYGRFWGEGSQGALAKLVLGAPWGLQLGLEGGIGTNDTHFIGLTLGIDFARLTIFRTVGENWFPNPYPAYRKMDDSGAPSH